MSLYRSALAYDPRLANTHFLLGSALSVQGKSEEAMAEYKAELKTDPEHLLALNDLAWLLSTISDARLRHGAEAGGLAEQACRLTQFREAQFVGTLAAAYAEAGRFAEAIKTAEKAAALASAAGQKQLAERNRELAEMYRAGKAYHEGGAAEN